MLNMSISYPKLRKKNFEEKLTSFSFTVAGTLGSHSGECLRLQEGQLQLSGRSRIEKHQGG